MKNINKTSIISFGLMLCILMPKLELFSIPGYHQGIRYDDLFLLIGIIYILLQKKIFIQIFPGGRDYFIFFGLIFLNALFSSFMYGPVSILIALRWIEYTIFFMLLFYSSFSHKKIRYFIIFYIIVNLGATILQYYGYMGGIYSHGYITNVESRISGITGGSWELPAILSLFIVPIIADKSFNVFYRFVIISLATIPVYLSGTRTGMIVYFMSVFLSVVIYYRLRILNLIMVGLLGILFVGQSRMEFVMRDNPEVPLSMNNRIGFWTDKFIEMDYIDYIFGKGLGYSGVVLDGMFARTFMDFGVLGLVLYFIYYYRLFRSYKIIGVIAILYSVSLDFFSSSKIMFSIYLSMHYLSMIEKNCCGSLGIPKNRGSFIK